MQLEICSFTKLFLFIQRRTLRHVSDKKVKGLCYVRNAMACFCLVFSGESVKTVTVKSRENSQL